MAVMLGGRPRAVWHFAWYVRIGIYLAGLVITALFVNHLRGRIPAAFGLTPIHVKALSVERMPSASARKDTVGVSISVQVVGNRSTPEGIRLDQFHLLTKREREYEPYASTLLFDYEHKLYVVPGDTLVGALFFALPVGEEPDQLWWRP